MSRERPVRSGSGQGTHVEVLKKPSATEKQHPIRVTAEQKDSFSADELIQTTILPGWGTTIRTAAEPSGFCHSTQQVRFL